MNKEREDQLADGAERPLLLRKCLTCRFSLFNILLLKADTRFETDV